MPTPIARLRRRLAARDWGLLALGVILGLLVLLTGRLARDDASTVAVKAATVEIQQRAYRQDIEAWRARLAGCRRGKQDRTANAKAFRAQANYLKKVLAAGSVKADVKRAARRNWRTQNQSATSLESRTGRNLDCAAATPKPPAPPGVKPLP